MKQTTLPFEEEPTAHLTIALEPEQEKALIELMARAIVAVIQPGQGEHDESD